MAPALYVATSNAGKLREFAEAAHTVGRIVLPLPDLRAIEPPPEDAPTFAGNACAKAIYYSRTIPGELVLADDSGLEVQGLNGAPGVRSARFAADAGFCPPGLTEDERNNLFLLRRLADAADSGRLARYRCVLAVARDGKAVDTAEGTVEGQILSQPRGVGGFGYDPLFYLPALDRTMAEIDGKSKWQISHRGNAFRALLQALRA